MWQFQSGPPRVRAIEFALTSFAYRYSLVKQVNDTSQVSWSPTHWFWKRWMDVALFFRNHVLI
jgi:hypothetical protein